VIPLRDVIPSRTTPFVTIALIVANIAVFLLEQFMPAEQLRHVAFTYGLVPASFSRVALFTSMFLHADWGHIIGNMLCLWIFGDNVEDRFGHGRFLVFYVAAGAAAGLLQTWFMPGSLVPTVGASGAIAGVMGAYFVLFPTSRVLVLVFLFIFIDIIEIPAVFFLGFWFLMQLASGIGRLSDTEITGGVAFWAHAAGFLSGIAGVWLLRRPERQRVDWWS
jgi:membrane associated rhomboid family serine protease